MNVYRGTPPTDGRSFVVEVMVPGHKTLLGPRLDLINHSPTGFAWGFGGSGPAQLALALLAHATRDDDRAIRLASAVQAQLHRDALAKATLAVQRHGRSKGPGRDRAVRAEGCLMSDAAKIPDLRRREKALATAERLIEQIASQSMSLNEFTQQMDELFDANRDLSEIQEARRDPWRDGTKVFDALDIVRQELRRHGAQI